MKKGNRKKRHMYIKKVLFWASIALAAAGCVPGEAVVTVTAADVECAMTGGVSRAVVEMVLTNSVPAVDPKKLPESVLKSYGIKAEDLPVDATLEVLKLIEETLAGFIPPGDTIKISARPDGTNVLMCIRLNQNAGFSADTNKLAACDFRSLRLHLDENGELHFSVDKAFAKQREILVGWMSFALYYGFEIDGAETYGLVNLGMALKNPFLVKTRKVLVTGEGASGFKVDGTTIRQVSDRAKDCRRCKLQEIQRLKKEA